ncbi:MAG: hypothetical protein CMM25_02680 [Rhodospirillaceae bacterium]|nr:hypothetical protein [Rhodospirillaceae bacterium]
MSNKKYSLNPYLLGNIAEIHGKCDPLFQEVADTFEQNFLYRGIDGEIGASCAVIIDGELIVDLWGGFAEPKTLTEWHENTICCCWSVSKTIGSVLTLMMIDQGLLNPSEPVATYWPEFSKNGKHGILVKHLLNHTAGLSYVDQDLSEGEINNRASMVSAIENTTPNWSPGSRLGYLNMTQGYLLGELCSRVNDGKQISQLLNEKIAGPLGLDWHFQITEDLVNRTANVYQANPTLFNDLINQNPDTIFAQSMKGRNPSETYNSDHWRTAENGSGTSHTNARSMAKLYSSLVTDCKLGAKSLFSKEVLNLAMTESILGVDTVNEIEMRFSLGFELNYPEVTPMGPNKHSFGYIGAGGSYAFADPTIRLGFGYSHNFMHSCIGPGPCGLPLVNKVMECAYK